MQIIPHNKDVGAKEHLFHSYNRGYCHKLNSRINAI